MKTFWMVLRESSGYTAKKQESYEIAEAEAKRLARQHPGERFYVLMAAATVKINDVIVDRVERLDDHIPF